MAVRVVAAAVTRAALAALAAKVVVAKAALTVVEARMAAREAAATVMAVPMAVTARAVASVATTGVAALAVAAAFVVVAAILVLAGKIRSRGSKSDCHRCMWSTSERTKRPVVVALWARPRRQREREAYPRSVNMRGLCRGDAEARYAK